MELVINKALTCTARRCVVYSVILLGLLLLEDTCGFVSKEGFELWFWISSYL